MSACELCEKKKLQFEENSLFIQKTKQGEVSKKNLNDNYLKWSQKQIKRLIWLHKRVDDINRVAYSSTSPSPSSPTPPSSPSPNLLNSRGKWTTMGLITVICFSKILEILGEMNKVDNGARGSSKVSLICLPPTNTAGVSLDIRLRIARFSETMNDCFSFVCLCLLCLTPGQSTQKRSLFVQKGVTEVWMLIGSLSILLTLRPSQSQPSCSIGLVHAFREGGLFESFGHRVEKLQGKLQSRASEKSKWELGEIEMGIANGPPTQEMDKLKPNSSCLRSIFEEKSCPFGSMIFTWKTIFFFSYQNQEMFFYNPMLNSACMSWWIFVIFSVCIRAALDF